MEENLKETNELLKKLLKKKTLSYSFLTGLAQSLGATVGLAIVAGIITYVLQHVSLANIVGKWLADVINNALNNI